MSLDLFLGRTKRNFAIGSLPEGARGYAPSKWVTRDEANAMVEALTRPSGFFSPGLSRERAEEKVLAQLRAKKIGIMSGTTRH